MAYSEWTVESGYFILSFIVIGLLFFVFHKKSSHHRSDRRKILFMGPTNSGKTSLFLTLLHQKFPSSSTYASMTWTQSWVPLSSLMETSGIKEGTPSIGNQQKFVLMDCPGHENVFFTSFKGILTKSSKPRLICLVIDACGLRSLHGIRDAVDHLLTAYETCQSHGIKLVLVGTKADEPIAQSKVVLYNNLRAELSALPTSKLDAVGNVSLKSREIQRQSNDLLIAKSLDQQGTRTDLQCKLVQELKSIPLYLISAKTGEGLDELKRFFYSTLI